MGNRIVGIIVLVAICIGIYYGYQHYKHGNAAEDGSIHWVSGKPSAAEQAQFNREDHGETADGQSEHKNESARQSAAEIANGGTGFNGSAPYRAAVTGTANDSFNNDPANRAIPAGDGGGTSIAPPPPQRVAANNPNASSDYLGTNGPTPVTYPPPASDSQSANAPNDMRFRGSGVFQWYRQGNLTWRIDTVTGRSCIVYATMEEWRKRIVLSHGCGRDA